PRFKTLKRLSVLSSPRPATRLPGPYSQTPVGVRRGSPPVDYLPAHPRRRHSALNSHRSPQKPHHSPQNFHGPRQCLHAVCPCPHAEWPPSRASCPSSLASRPS